MFIWSFPLLLHAVLFKSTSTLGYFSKCCVNDYCVLVCLWHLQMDELLLLLQMVNPNLRAWASQDPWLVELPAQECPAQPEGSDGTLGLGW